MKKNDAKALWRMDRDHFIHPYTDFATFREEGSHIITEAEGVYVTDAQGNRFLDGIAGLWCVNIGHGRREMAECVAAQTLRMEYYNPFGHSGNEPAALLSAKLAELAPGDLNHVFYATGGSTANDASIRLAHYYNNLRGKPRKKKVISRLRAYHGSTYVTANLTGIHDTKRGFDRIADDWIHHVSAPDMYRRPRGAERLNEADYCDFLIAELDNRITQLGADNVAAFIAEPIIGAGGVLVAPEGYHRKAWEVCRKHDVLYIADEVVTGFGRLGHWFASESAYGHVPDILVGAKGVTSGYIPLGFALFSDEIYSVISQPQCEGGLLSMGFTYSGHPVACAAALKNIEIMARERLCEKVRELGPKLFSLARSLSDLPIVGDVRGSHFMLGIEFVEDKASQKPFPAQARIAERVFRHCHRRGLIVRPLGQQVVLSPPLILDLPQARKMFAILRAAIEETCADLKREGLPG